jgi:hypothetical protein
LAKKKDTGRGVQSKANLGNRPSIASPRLVSRSTMTGTNKIGMSRAAQYTMVYPIDLRRSLNGPGVVAAVHVRVLSQEGCPVGTA